MNLCQKQSLICIKILRIYRLKNQKLQYLFFKTIKFKNKFKHDIVNKKSKKKCDFLNFIHVYQQQYPLLINDEIFNAIYFDYTTIFKLTSIWIIYSIIKYRIIT